MIALYIWLEYFIVDFGDYWDQIWEVLMIFIVTNKQNQTDANLQDKYRITVQIWDEAG